MDVMKWDEGTELRGNVENLDQLQFLADYLSKGLFTDFETMEKYFFLPITNGVYSGFVEIKVGTYLSIKVPDEDPIIKEYAARQAQEVERY